MTEWEPRTQSQLWLRLQVKIAIIIMFQTELIDHKNVTIFEKEMVKTQVDEVETRYFKENFLEKLLECCGYFPPLLAGERVFLSSTWA